MKNLVKCLFFSWAAATALFAAELSDAEWDLMNRRLVRILYESDRYDPVSEERKEELAAENLSNVRQAMSTLSDGRFPDIDYREKAYEHAIRIYSMALEYARENGPLQHDPELLNTVHQALGNWFEEDYSPGKRWTDAVFRIPRSLYWAALLLGDDLDSNYIPLIGNYAEYDPEQRVGQNRIWICSHQLYWAVFTKDEVLLKRLSRLVQGELAFQPRGEEGLQYDFSWLQHGPQLYTGGYGLPVVIEVGRVAQALVGTPYEFSDESRNMLADYVLKGLRWILWRNRIDYSTRGRGLVILEDLDRSPPSLRSRFYCVALSIMMDVDPENRSQYETTLREMDSVRGESLVLVGNRYYPCSDYMVHRGRDWFASIRMVSTRTHSTEQGASEGFKNYYLADGGNFLYLSGHEYLNIFPVWDWRKVPGVTCEDSDAPIPYIGWDDRELRRGGSPFAGGVSDGTNGVCAMILKKDGVSARKSWFFLDDGYVCLGAGIQGPSGVHLSTSVNQCLTSGEALFFDGTQTNTIAGEIQTEQACMVLHDGVGYFFPESQRLTIRYGDQSGYEESVMMDARDGDWRAVDLSQCEEITKTVFSLHLSHDQGANERYSYYVEPSVSKENPFTRLMDFPVEILVNTPQLQAVRQKSDGLIQAVFYDAGELDVPEFGRLSVDSPSIIMIRPEASHVQVSVADPSQSLESLQIVINGMKKHVSLPIGPMAGMTVEVPVVMNK